MTDRQHKQTTQSVQRCLDILEAVAASDGPVGVSSLARDVGLSKATTYRLCQTLVDRHFLEQHPQTGEYQLGWRLLRITSRVMGRIPFANICRPTLEQMAAQGRQNAFAAAVLDHRGMIVCEEVRVPNAVQPQSLLGQRWGLLEAPGGLLCLARLPDDTLRRAVKDLLRSSLDSHSLQDVLNRVYSMRGCAHVRHAGVGNANIATICSPVTGRHGQVVGVVGFCYVILPVDGADEENLARICGQSAALLSASVTD